MGDQITVTAHGALFDGRATPAVDRALQDAQWDVGSQGLANWHLFLDQSIRHPTPYYETQVTVQRMATDVVVHDRGIVYGPWLEGVGSRNRSTRFKGYFSLRRAYQELRGQAQHLAERAIRRGVESIR
jgi:hypothetical protein